MKKVAIVEKKKKEPVIKGRLLKVKKEEKK
jgi:hypothetical protein